jgi:hypothetical protein
LPRNEIIQNSADDVSEASVIADDISETAIIADNISEDEINENVKAINKGINKKIIIIAGAALIVIILAIVIVSTTMLFGDDKIACNYIIQEAENFKNPESVRMVGGTLGVDKDCLFTVISAENSYGARVQNYYYISIRGLLIIAYQVTNIYILRLMN